MLGDNTISLKSLLKNIALDIKRFEFYDNGLIYKLIKVIYILFFNAEFKPVLRYRLSNYFYYKGIIGKFVSKIIYEGTKKKYTVDINPKSKIGPGLKIVHLGSIVVGSDVIIGLNCTLQSCITLGEKSSREKGMPRIGNNIYVGTGAKVLGNIYIDDNVIIGANSVVIKSVVKNSVIAGVPAIERKKGV